MEYRIEMSNGRNRVRYSRKEVIETLERLKEEGFQVIDVRKVYKTGFSDSILESYQKYL